MEELVMALMHSNDIAETTASEPPNTEAALEQDPAIKPTGFIDTIHDEILEHKIFPFFNLRTWMFRLIRVCKKWKHIYERSNHPKQLYLRRPLNNKLPRAMELIKRYQPTTIQFEWRSSKDQGWISIYSILTLVQASKRCNTVVIPNSILKEGGRPLEHHKLPQITTVCLHIRDLHCLDFFPNVQNLQIMHLRGKLERTIWPPSLKKMAVNSLVTRNWICNDVDVVMSRLSPFPPGAISREYQVDPLKELSYKDFLTHCGATKMHQLVREGKIDQATQLLQTGETSLQLEIELSFRWIFYHDYSFGVKPPKMGDFKRSVLDLENFYTLEIARDFHNQLNLCGIQVDPRITLNLVARFGTVDECIAALRAVKGCILLEMATDAFFRICLKKEISDILLQEESDLYMYVHETVLAIVLAGFSANGETLNFLREFLGRHNEAPYYPKNDEFKACDVFRIIVMKACAQRSSKLFRISFGLCLIHYLKETQDLTLVDEVIKVNANIIDELLKMNRFADPIFKSLVERFNYDVDKVALKRLKTHPESIAEFSKVFNINWDRVVEIENKSPFLEFDDTPDLLQKHITTVLNCGADPKKVPIGSETVVNFVLRSEAADSQKIQMIDALLAFGVDINEPSISPDGTTNTPLSLAVMRKASPDLRNFLKFRGALPSDQVVMTE